MESELLKVIRDELVALSINYEYGEYTGTLAYPYSVGEYNETGFDFENGKTNGEFILTTWQRGSESSLIAIKEAVKSKFANYRATTASGTVAINFRNKLFVRTGEAELKKMEIYLDTNYWKGV